MLLFLFSLLIMMSFFFLSCINFLSIFLYSFEFLSTLESWSPFCTTLPTRTGSPVGPAFSYIIGTATVRQRAAVPGGGLDGWVGSVNRQINARVGFSTLSDSA